MDDEYRLAWANIEGWTTNKRLVASRTGRFVRFPFRLGGKVRKPFGELIAPRQG
jgi:hypothetical protein